MRLQWIAGQQLQKYEHEALLRPFFMEHTYFTSSGASSNSLAGCELLLQPDRGCVLVVWSMICVVGVVCAILSICGGV